jgi:hypothetical protein
MALYEKQVRRDTYNPFFKTDISSPIGTILDRSIQTLKKVDARERSEAELQVQFKLEQYKSKLAQWETTRRERQSDPKYAQQFGSVEERFKYEADEFANAHNEIYDELEAGMGEYAKNAFALMMKQSGNAAYRSMINTINDRRDDAIRKQYIDRYYGSINTGDFSSAASAVEYMKSSPIFLDLKDANGKPIGQQMVDGMEKNLTMHKSAAFAQGLTEAEAAEWIYGFSDLVKKYGAQVTDSDRLEEYHEQWERVLFNTPPDQMPEIMFEEGTWANLSRAPEVYKIFKDTFGPTAGEVIHRLPPGAMWDLLSRDPQEVKEILGDTIWTGINATGQDGISSASITLPNGQVLTSEGQSAVSNTVDPRSPIDKARNIGDILVEKLGLRDNFISIKAGYTPTDSIKAGLAGDIPGNGIAGAQSGSGLGYEGLPAPGPTPRFVTVEGGEVYLRNIPKDPEGMKQALAEFQTYSPALKDAMEANVRAATAASGSFSEDRFLEAITKEAKARYSDNPTKQREYIEGAMALAEYQRTASPEDLAAMGQYRDAWYTQQIESVERDAAKDRAELHGALVAGRPVRGDIFIDGVNYNGKSINIYQYNKWVSKSGKTVTDAYGKAHEVPVRSHVRESWYVTPPKPEGQGADMGVSYNEIYFKITKQGYNTEHIKKLISQEFGKGTLTDAGSKDLFRLVDASEYNQRSLEINEQIKMMAKRLAPKASENDLNILANTIQKEFYAESMAHRIGQAQTLREQLDIEFDPIDAKTMEKRVSEYVNGGKLMLRNDETVGAELALRASSTTLSNRRKGTDQNAITSAGNDQMKALLAARGLGKNNADIQSAVGEQASYQKAVFEYSKVLAGFPDVKAEPMKTSDGKTLVLEATQTPMMVIEHAGAKVYATIGYSLKEGETDNEAHKWLYIWVPEGNPVALGFVPGTYTRRRLDTGDSQSFEKEYAALLKYMRENAVKGDKK